MKNNKSCKVIGIRIIRIKMHDGIVKTLSNMRHIPNLRKNLIFLSTLDLHGFNYSDEGGVLKISKSALIVLKGKLSNGFYLFQGSTVVDVTLIFLLDSDSDNTCLWLMHLDHIEEADMSFLSK